MLIWGRDGEGIYFWMHNLMLHFVSLLLLSLLLDDFPCFRYPSTYPSVYLFIDSDLSSFYKQRLVLRCPIFRLHLSAAPRRVAAVHFSSPRSFLPWKRQVTMIYTLIFHWIGLSANLLKTMFFLHVLTIKYVGSQWILYGCSRDITGILWIQNSCCCCSYWCDCEIVIVYWFHNHHYYYYYSCYYYYY